MVTVYSEKKKQRTLNAGDYDAQQSVIENVGSSYEAINRKISDNLKAFETIDWSKTGRR